MNKNVRQMILKKSVANDASNRWQHVGPKGCMTYVGYGLVITTNYEYI